MNDNACPARGFFTYDAFITAAKFFPSFGNTGDLATRKKEIAAFFGQTSHETTGNDHYTSVRCYFFSTQVLKLVEKQLKILLFCLLNTNTHFLI